VARWGGQSASAIDRFSVKELEKQLLAKEKLNSKSKLVKEDKLVSKKVIVNLFLEDLKK